jgi:hypothetical protein
MGKVVRLKPKHERLEDEKIEAAIHEDEAAFLEDLRGLLWAKAGSRDGKWQNLAARARLHRTTIAKFAQGTTKRPQLFTIRRMFIALDYVMTIVPRKRERTKK